MKCNLRCDDPPFTGVTWSGCGSKLVQSVHLSSFICDTCPHCPPPPPPMRLGKPLMPIPPTILTLAPLLPPTISASCRPSLASPTPSNHHRAISLSSRALWTASESSRWHGGHPGAREPCGSERGEWRGRNQARWQGFVAGRACGPARMGARGTRGFGTSAVVRHGGEKGEPGKGIKVTFHTPEGDAIECWGKPDQTVLDVAHANDVDLEGACEGSCACSTCHVILTPEYFDALEEPSDEENDMLDLAFGLTETSRLGCQIKLTQSLSGIECTLPSATRNMAVDGYKPKVSVVLCCVGCDEECVTERVLCATTAALVGILALRMWRTGNGKWHIDRQGISEVWSVGSLKESEKMAI
ncbi:hypothetical protein M427DRAFT_416236 [Gonapodya prolifera JEL478]|uniref:2Fe-2S ferredoxin-type domain-containing protein n=1 Tax=Gonapodya prolifera (strain JEL478) TaxID=1344416 RepID=A0A139A629_GONPJ|nr:hypothetical protein M427DRAFT_416236 [Gonapodya prolifera JEL478]|eukprot:KXS11905.1 hypothetical protein M427DRAFT_416236 [Gonapodya prolifera JEL478]